MRRSNCFVVALHLWLIRYRCRGYCAIRRTRPPIRWGWHWVYIPLATKWHKAGRPLRLRTLHYEPIHREKKWWRAAVHKLWFTGRMRRYDAEWRGD